MNDIREKLKSVLSKHNVTLSSIAVDSAMQTRLSRQVNMGASITYDTIYRFLEVFPDVSAEWLLRGKGEMLISENTIIVPVGDKDISPEKLSSLESKVSTLTEENFKLLAKLDYMEEYSIKLAARLNKAEEALQQYEPKKKNIS